MDGFVYCLDLNDGKEIWRFRTGDNILSTPQIIGKMVYIGSYDCNLYAINAENGREAWRFKTGGAVLNFAQFLVKDNIIYFGSWDSNLYAIDAKTGKELWRFKTGNGTMSSPLYYENTLYFGSKDGFIYALNMEGKEMWRYKSELYLHSTVIVEKNGIIYFGGGDYRYLYGYVYALSADGR